MRIPNIFIQITKTKTLML